MDPHLIKAALTRAAGAIEKADFAAATQECQAVLRAQPGNAAASHMMGVIAAKTERAADAVAFLDAAAKAEPGNADYLLDLALVLDTTGRQHEAWPFYQRAARAAPRNPRVLGATVNFMARLGFADALLPLYRQAAALGWRDLGTSVVAGNLFYYRFQYAEAREMFADALKLDIANPDARRGMGMTLACLKQFREALPYLETAHTPEPGAPELRIHLWARACYLAAKAGIALEERDWSVATDQFKDAIDILRKVLPQSFPAPPAAADAARQVHKVMYIEVELLAREFEARVLLALHAAAQGIDVVVGQKLAFSQITHARLPAGMVLVKTMNGNDVERIKQAAAAGHVVAVLDEEAFGGSGKRPLWMRLNTDPEAIARTDVIIAQGEEYADLLFAVFPEVAARTLVLGNPKVDLYRPEFRKPSDRPRDKILICSQSQVCNPNAVGFSDLISMHVRGVPMGDQMGLDVMEGTKDVVAFEISMIPQLQAVTRALAEKHPGTRIQFRPHPAEDPTLWARAFAGLANVTVSSAGSMADALADAKALIYVRGCATGLEAHFQEIPIVRFDGDRSAPEPGNWISSDIGFPARDAGEVLDAVARIDRGERTQTEDRAVVLRSFHGNGQELVCVGVAAGLAGIIKSRLLPDPSARAQLVAALSGVRVSQRAFDAHKFPPTSAAEVQALADRLARVAGLKAPKVEALAPNVFLFGATGGG